MILNDFALLLSDTARSKAYLQAMIQEDKKPAICIVYSDDIAKMKRDSEEYKDKGRAVNYFDIDEPILYSLHESDIDYILLKDKNINSPQMEDILREVKQKYIIYSGYGGYILKPHLFRLDKKFIHVHAGILPQYRGSTTIYYSFLQERILGATAIFLNEGIDEGKIITQETFAIPGEPIDIDYIYEPFMRSRVLMKVINQYLLYGYLTAYPQDKKEEETYFIIHPVLKHLAMLEIDNIQELKRGKE